MSAHTYAVRLVAEYGSTTHYRVSSGPKGGPEVTVRVGMRGVFACLNPACLPNAIRCDHAIAAREYAAECAAPAPTVDVAREATA